MMGTRVGDVDPGALTFLMLQAQPTAEQLQKIINKESGMLGIAGKSDMREIESAVNAGDEIAKLGLDMYEQRITSTSVHTQPRWVVLTSSYSQVV